MRGQKRHSKLRERFGQQVRSLRTGRGLTQEQLAERAEISVDFLSLIERGRSSPSFDNLDDIAQALEVSVADMFSFQEIT